MDENELHPFVQRNGWLWGTGVDNVHGNHARDSVNDDAYAVGLFVCGMVFDPANKSWFELHRSLLRCQQQLLDASRKRNNGHVVRAVERELHGGLQFQRGDGRFCPFNATVLCRSSND